jgi:hypothetical protein
MQAFGIGCLLVSVVLFVITTILRTHGFDVTIYERRRSPITINSVIILTDELI